MSGYIHSRVFNNNFNINYGYISCAIMAEDMNQIFENADITRRDDDGQLNMDRTTVEEQNKCKFAKELPRTVSSCFETPVWGMCTGTEPHVQ